MIIRSAAPRDEGGWIEMRCELWPGSRLDHEQEAAAHFSDPPPSAACFVAEGPNGDLIGFVEVSCRDYAEGCSTSPVGYLEGIFVRPPHRGRGVGSELVRAAERWAVSMGCTEMASDRELVNEPSGTFHAALGYEEVERIVCFRKDLPQEGAAA